MNYYTETNPTFKKLFLEYKTARATDRTAKTDSLGWSAIKTEIQSFAPDGLKAFRRELRAAEQQDTERISFQDAPVKHCTLVIFRDGRKRWLVNTRTISLNKIISTIRKIVTRQNISIR